MKWIKRAVLAALTLITLLCGLALMAFVYTYHYVSSPPVDDPHNSLLSWQQPATEKLAPKAAWLAEARQDQSLAITLQDFQDPPLRFGPWTRWWWPGNLVTKGELEREMRLFAAAGIAGVEVQAFAISVSADDISGDTWTHSGWDSPSYYENVRTVMQAALELDMGVDLNNGSGWPTGGPHVALNDGLRQLLHSEIVVTGPQTLDINLPKPQMPAATFGAGALGMIGDIPMQTFAVDKRELVAVVAAKIVENGRTWQPWDFLDRIKLAPNSIQIITPSVHKEHLKWAVPKGDWAITALWQLPGGELISGGYAHPKPGYVVDHLDAQRMRANQDYLFRPETGLTQYYGTPLRAFFNDSLEFRQERHWARGHLDEFSQRIGYDPRRWLSALIEPGKDQMPFHAANIATAPAYDLGELGIRFLEDWDQVTSDLFRERYFQTLRQWGKERGLAHRLQAYGGPMDIIRGAGESDIPEAEQLYAGGSEMFLKAVSSGAHIADKPLVSAESFIFLGRAFMTTPLKLKALSDKAFVAGINQLVYHGSAYRIENHAQRGYPKHDGWYPWQLGMLSTDYSENWSYWPHAAVLNRYIARNQYLLRKGEPEADVLLLYPGLGFPQGYSNPQEPFDQGRFAGEEALTTDNSDAASGRGTERMRDIWRASRKLEQQGLTWAWVNEHALATATFSAGSLHVGKLRASALKLHAIQALSPAVAEHIATLARAGLPVHITGETPYRQHGLKDYERGDKRVLEAFAGLPIPETLAASPIKYENESVKSLRRRLPDGDIIQFFSNPSAQPITLTVELPSGYRQSLWLDTWHGTAQATILDTDKSASIELPAYGSMTLWLRRHGYSEISTKRFNDVQATALEQWQLEVNDVGLKLQGPLPGDWLQNPRLRDSGGPGNYTTTFELPAATLERIHQGNRLTLDLGNLYGAATVTCNGIDVGAALVPPFHLDVSASVKAGINTLRVTLTPPRKNRLVKDIENGEQGWNAPDLVGTSARVSAGLMGPVRLVEQSTDAGGQAIN